ncbi:TPA: hypothetical protein N0F65_000966 [Lagenidium giganteum]|uniref:Tc1-like transposase DDE domain-containing protein n=1 Tax=Lagenidium giganteum TaxID=4803 RepID=A0AAV2YV87_9STRA|nr:TPA: hypothetical protein N0F65_000966 [Lagenidium giganteum]
MIMYYDVTNFNVHCRRLRGRAAAVSSSMGLAVSRITEGSIKMNENAAFVKEIYAAAKASRVYADDFAGKKILIVFDNAPAYHQTELLVEDADDLVLLSLAPYSPMLNPIEGCFSVVKARVREHLREHRDTMASRGTFPTMAAQRMHLLCEAAAAAGLQATTPRLVTHGGALRSAFADGGGGGRHALGRVVPCAPL